MSTWREMVKEVMADYGESWCDVEAMRPIKLDLDRCFNATSDKKEGCSFYIWTRRRIYFACVSEGLEWVSSLSRHPNSAIPRHIGDEI